ncbi:MAG TPA: hypothetical protein VMU99_04430 [Acidimicrobiales bacterium]|nr:hypothetical protein [Acidimicrobiales bacterium]
MRVLVVGTVPPPGGKGAKELADVVAKRIEDGDEVEILSPDPRSAAHHTANLESLMLPLRLALLSSRFDALELRIETRLPFASEVHRALRAVTLFSLGVCFGMYSEVTLRLDSPIPLPGGVGGRATKDMWRRATRIIVANQEDYLRVLFAPGVTEERVEIVQPVVVEARPVEYSWPSPTEPDIRVRVLRSVRSRAEAERRANSARVDLGAKGIGPLSSTAFSSAVHVAPSVRSVVHALISRIVREVSSR